jgi:hypothetical protein
MSLITLKGGLNSRRTNTTVYNRFKQVVAPCFWRVMLSALAEAGWVRRNRCFGFYLNQGSKQTSKSD